MSQTFKTIGYQLAWLARDNHGEVYLYINQDTRADITVKVQAPSDLIAWDELLSQKGMTSVDWGRQAIFTPIKRL